jgi:endoglucanase
MDDRILLAQKVLVFTEKGPLHGIIGSKPPHILKEEERKRVATYDELFIDIGAESQREAEKMGVKIGDAVAFDAKFAKINKNIVMGKAFDARAACVAMIEALKRLKNTDCTVFAVGTVQEEVGLRGATTSAFGINPDVGIALDVTIAGDMPGIKEGEAPIRLGKGPALSVVDAGLLTHPRVLRLLVDVAKENKIPYQLEAVTGGQTDAAKISLTNEGVPSGAISIPTRYIHSPTAMLNLKDLEDTIKLTVAAVQAIPKYF